MTRFTKLAATVSLSALFVAPGAVAQTAMTPNGTGARTPMGRTTTMGRSGATTRMAPRGGAMGGGTMPGGGNRGNANGGNGPGGRY